MGTQGRADLVVAGRIWGGNTRERRQWSKAAKERPGRRWPALLGLGGGSGQLGEELGVSSGGGGEARWGAAESGAWRKEAAGKKGEKGSSRLREGLPWPQ